MARKFGLGKGLEALLPGDGDLNENSGPIPGKEISVVSPPLSVPAGGVTLLSPEKLIPNPAQPRKNFDQAELEELAESIAEHGIIQPIIVARAIETEGGTDGGETYIIIAGERRTRAARLAGLTEVPVIIRDYTDQKRMEISLIENIQRTDLNPIEEAAAYKNLMDFSGLSQDEVAARVGKNRSTVANALRLLKLPVVMQKSIEEGGISAGHARALLSVSDNSLREKLFRDILGQGLSVREAEKRAAALHKGPPSESGAEGSSQEKTAPGRPVELDDMEEKFIGRLGTKVVIEGDLNKGRIYIDYYSMDDLDRLYGLLEK